MIRKTIIAFFLLALAHLSYSQNGWERMADMDQERIYHRTCIWGDYLFVFSLLWPGSHNGCYKSSAEAYDISGNKWYPIAPMPRPIGTPFVCVYEGMIYVIGGWFDQTETAYATRLNFQYNPVLNTWLQKESCPAHIAESPSCQLNGKIYIFGDRQDADPFYPLKRAYVYTIVNDSWEALGEMNYIHSAGDAVSVDDIIYIIGGGIDYLASDVQYNNIGRCEKYDPETREFTEIKQMPYPVTSHSSVVYRDRILVFGGDTADIIYQNHIHATDLIQEYNPSTDTWRVMKGMPFDRFEGHAERKDNFVYIIGGQDNEDHRLRELWRFDLNYLEPLTPVEPAKVIPSDFKQRIYPNPLSNRAMISFKIVEPGNIQLEILNACAQRVELLLNSHEMPGYYSIEWDASARVPGLYFCRLSSEDREEISKIVIIR
jgi:N-acetylneuraminic acid mutarotase